MTTIDVHGYTASGSIDATIDGQRMTVPDDMNNRHRQMIHDLWEFDGETRVRTIPAYQDPPLTADQVYAEKDRRLALGFNYTFPDDRGVQHIGTTDADMKGWSEVTTWATAKLMQSQPAVTLTISTNTGVIEITPVEWFQVLDAAANFRQPLWTASFAIAGMEPIPSDFADDSYWA